MEVAATPVGAAVAPGTPDAAAKPGTPVKAKFDPSQYDAAELEAWSDSRQHKVKINGQEKQLSQAELKKLASLSDSSDQKFKTAAQKEREVADFKKSLENGDLVDFLKKQGKDSREIKSILEDKLLALIEEENMDPTQKELRDLKKEKADREAAKKAQDEELEGSKRKEEVTRIQQDFETDVVEAMISAQLPKHPFIAKMVIQEMLGAAEVGYDMPAADAVKNVKAAFTKQVSELLPLLGMDAVKSILGDKMMKSLREDSVRDVKQSSEPFPKPQPRKPGAGKQAVASVEAEDGESSNTFFRKLRRGG